MNITRSATSVRRYFLLINSLLIALLLWLTLSFWYDAFVQKKDATLMQENVEEGELLRLSASALASERNIFSASSKQLLRKQSGIAQTKIL